MTTSSERIDEKSDNSLIFDIREGDDQAADGLYRRYATRIRGLVQSQMGDALRARIDPEDVVQSIFKSVFRGVLDGAYEAPEGQTLWQLLAVISINKIRRKGRMESAEKRDLSRTSELSSEEYLPGLLDHHELELCVKEVLDLLTPEDRQVVELRLANYSVEEISQKINRSRRSTERSLQRIREQLTKILDLEI
ncbi:MAG: sigma-70 family RNA polymerase sigma factor [Pirellula sp.]|jgi:RNA polymerase sigma-70 factor (ECF subfamily)|nr:sigma-70 family RNA polymerase sigma factor [Pirellula sp.]